MKIVNRTDYRTEDLRAIAKAIWKEENHDMSATRKADTRIIFMSSQTRLHGTAVIDSCRIEVFIPKKFKSWIKPEWVHPYLCSLIAHEILHVASKRHGNSFERHYRKTPRYGYAGHYSDGYVGTLDHWKYMETFPLRKVETKPKVKQTTAQKIQLELDRLAKRRITWETKQKRCATTLKTIEKRRKTLTRRLAKREKANV